MIDQAWIETRLKLYLKTTAAPWILHGYAAEIIDGENELIVRTDYERISGGTDQMFADVEFIADAHACFPAALIELRRLLGVEEERDRAVAQLQKYKEAVTDKLHYDMKSVTSDTPENLLKRELQDWRERAMRAEARLAAK